VITSRDNEKLKLVRKLADRRWRDKLGMFVVEGEDAVEAAEAAGISPVELLVAGESVAAGLLGSVSDLPHPPRVVAVYRHADLPRELPSNRLLLTLALWQVSDPGNVGTLIRTSGAFGARVALSAGCGDPTSPRALRASTGAVFRVPLVGFEDVVGRKVGLSAHGGRPLTEIELGDEVTFVLGSERSGLPARVLETCDEVATIPIAPGSESLNVAAAGAIALYEWSRQHP
jgi:TrmH family RNA methyltransferase